MSERRVLMRTTTVRDCHGQPILRAGDLITDEAALVPPHWLDVTDDTVVERRHHPELHQRLRRLHYPGDADVVRLPGFARWFAVVGSPQEPR